MFWRDNKADNNRLQAEGSSAGESEGLVSKSDKSIQKSLREFDKPCDEEGNWFGRTQAKDGRYLLMKNIEIARL